MNGRDLTGPGCFSASDMAHIAEDAGIYKTNKPLFQTYISAILAGAFISIAFVFYITATTGTADVPFGWSKFLGGACFSLGLMLVVACGVDLFTSTILTCVAKAGGRISGSQMAANWLNVYIGNFIGALSLVAIMWFAGQHVLDNGQWGLNVLNTAQHKLEHSFIEAVFLGIMANVMVCLAVWMSYAGKSLIDKMFILILPISMFVASGFEHSIANMFMIPMGIIIKDFATPEFWHSVGADPQRFADLTVSHFLVKNLLPVTIGNILGGMMVGLPFWYMYLRKPHEGKASSELALHK
ncbi:formate transporter FocA [Leminorella grimontii]|uniref:Formate transporter FocA n=1 Tax=Leminorella grimontii TaxID=82981 RepID=A0AAV5MZU2_9GAMM|nr:formate transporter FocA [Leminorella grimontii]KFC95912.1 formate efflux transporter [Leminorella grimontii ATCC 33999 = DSM 5078]GKX54909.1 formate transporter FocA [Leminorella grimontii]GKX58328.1 formate transporter FocA [Leminorella grimontii]VFS58137.1 Formate channel 1 [Leminorella grimontii]